MINKINTKASCGSQGCSLLPDTRPYGYAHEPLFFEGKIKTSKVKAKDKK